MTSTEIVAAIRAELDGYGAATVRQLADRLGVGPGLVRRQLDNLRRRGLVQKHGKAPGSPPQLLFAIGPNDWPIPAPAPPITRPAKRRPRGEARILQALDWQAGQTAAEMAHRFGVCRKTVRESAWKLEREGAIESERRPNVEGQRGGPVKEYRLTERAR